jgi:hypothetical protein
MNIWRRTDSIEAQLLSYSGLAKALRVGRAPGTTRIRIVPEKSRPVMRTNVISGVECGALRAVEG